VTEQHSVPCVLLLCWFSTVFLNLFTDSTTTNSWLTVKLRNCYCWTVLEESFSLYFFDCYKSHVCVQHQTEQDIKSLCTENNASINFRCLEMWAYYWIWCLSGVESMILCFATAAPYYGCLHKIQQSLWYVTNYRKHRHSAGSRCQIYWTTKCITLNAS